MIIKHIAHSCFEISLESGNVIVTDPYDPSTGYPTPKIDCQTVLISHHHHDHDWVENVPKNVKIIDKPGYFSLKDGTEITGISTFHDNDQGRKRGNNVMFLVEAEGLRLLHMGDLGHMLPENILRKIGCVDVLMIPVGGFFTIDAKQAAETAAAINPKVVIPMHYRTSANGDWPIEDIKPFISEIGRKVPEMPFIRVTGADIECQPECVLLTDDCYGR